MEWIQSLNPFLIKTEAWVFIFVFIWAPFFFFLFNITDICLITNSRCSAAASELFRGQPGSQAGRNNSFLRTLSSSSIHNKTFHCYRHLTHEWVHRSFALRGSGGIWKIINQTVSFVVAQLLWNHKTYFYTFQEMVGVVSLEPCFIKRRFLSRH